MISERSKSPKRRLNSWSFRRLQVFIEYKALWVSIKVIKMKPPKHSGVCAVCGRVMQDPKAKTPECCGLNRHLNACLNMPKIQDESLRLRMDRPANVAVTWHLNEAVSQSGEATPKGYQPKR